MDALNKRTAYNEAEAAWWSHEADCPVCREGGRCVIGGRLLVKMGDAARAYEKCFAEKNPFQVGAR